MSLLNGFKGSCELESRGSVHRKDMKVLFLKLGIGPEPARNTTQDQ